MLRGLALILLLLVAGAAPAVGQAHPPHAPGHAHRPGHIPMDSATHAALHALLHGSWTGTLTSTGGISSGMEMSVAQDTLQKAMVTMHTGQPLRAGATSDFVVERDKVRWTQELSDMKCEATALLKAATPHEPPTMNGKLLCGDGELRFTLHKTE